MKRVGVSGPVTFVLGLLVALGPQFIFKVCSGSCCCDALPRCFWSAQAEIGLGLIIVALGICLIIFDDLKIQLGLTIGVFLTGIMALCIPHVLIGGCEMLTMACRKVAFPALTVVCTVITIAAVINIFYLERKIKNCNERIAL